MELDKLKLEKGESERFEKRQAKKHEIELKNMEKNSKFEGDVREHASVAVGNLVEQINDPESFKQSAAVIMEVTKKIFPPPVQENDSPLIFKAKEIRKALTMKGENLFDDTRKILTEIMADIGNSGCEPSIKNEMLSITTKLITETYREEKSDFAKIQNTVEQLTDIFIGQRKIFTRETSDKIKNLREDIETVKSKLEINF
jgi:hypothetical protein